MLCRLVTSLVIGAFVSLPVLAEEPSPPATEPSTAEAILRSATERITQAKSFTVDAKASVVVGMPGFEHEKYGRYKVAAERPNQLLVLRTDGEMGGTVANDGKKLLMYNAELQQYIESEAAPSLDMLSSDFGMMSLLEGGMGGLFLPLLADDPVARLTGGTTASQVVGVEKIDGLECHHLKFEQESSDLNVWVTTGAAPTIRRISPDLSKQFAGEEGADDFSITVVVDLRAWDLPAELNDEMFAFTPPASAELKEEFAAVAPSAVMPPIAAGPSHPPLLGELAPEFALIELSGTKAFELKPLIGQKVILLDFWATWCGPCRKGLPTIAEVAKEYSDKPLAVYGVNVQEDADAIREFLDETKLELQVLRDVGGEVASSYQVTGIPHTVLIGLDGRVQVVHVGVASKEELTAQIDALLNREDLATKQLNAEQPEAAAESEADAEPSEPEAEEPAKTPEAEPAQADSASGE
ncbi:DUF2092 domain-containing protein [Aeoliella mucimassa]|uniref:Thiol-disulfide oxidoreductase ResA n=1 Tax=Aeoliella mucimassa TaxID=2527972 RepID=A0A518ASU8_9BACT|nr:DUF2092 domain-containing protein [Aeoliella mucimassa]QDU57811.1 Thiol-disulfide oxidoreductase ResA [Aeoliella mucimassa]